MDVDESLNSRFASQIGINASTNKPDIQVVNVGVEAKFCEFLKHLQQGLSDSLELIRQFKDVSSTKAIQVKDELFNDSAMTSDGSYEEFENWQLETKLWDLVEILYHFRLSKFDAPKLSKYSSISVKEEHFRIVNTKLAELTIIMTWIRNNSQTVDTSDLPLTSKWRHTKQSVQTSDLNVLSAEKAPSYSNELDIDGPLRTGKSLHPDDIKNDDIIFKTIYKLLLTNDYDGALALANESGNYTLSMILVGGILPCLDEVVDKEYISSVNIDSDQLQGCKHKLLYYKSIYKLCQQTSLNKYEKLIYNYLCGANINENLKESDDWNESLLLYCNQIVVYETIKFYESQLHNKDWENLSISIPKPQVDNIEAILNILLTNPNSSIAEASRHPIRIVIGGVLIKKVSPLVTDITKSSNNNNQVYRNNTLLRIVSHLAIFVETTQIEPLNPQDFSKLIKLYINGLSEKSLDLVPFYLPFIPNDSEAMECYSEILINLNDKTEKINQVKISKTIPYFNTSIDESNEERMNYFLRKTVEKILDKTEAYYKSNGDIEIKDNTDSITPVDKLLYESVDWFVINNMPQDIIIVSIIIIKRFLLCGKLAALKEFAKEKNFKQTINSYDNELGTKNLLNPERATSPVPLINDEDREELISYDSLIRGLVSISEWKKFIEDNGNDKSNFVNKAVENSIEKTTKQLNGLIMKWFINTSNDLLKEFRNLYIPYLIIELLKIYEFSRFNNQQYLEKSFDLIKLVANEDENDLLDCFKKSGKLKEFLYKCGEVSLVASEGGVKGIFT